MWACSGGWRRRSISYKFNIIMDQERAQKRGDEKIIPALGMWGRMMEWYYDFLDKYVRETPNGWILPVLILVTGLLGVAGQIFDLTMREGKEYAQFWHALGEMGVYDSSQGVSVKLIVFLLFVIAPLLGMVSYWLLGGIAYLGIYLVGYRGFVETRRLVFYLHLGLTLMAVVLVGLLLVCLPLALRIESMSMEMTFLGLMLMLFLVVLIVGSVLLGYLLYKGFEYLVGMTVGGFIIVNLLWVLILFMVVVVGAVLWSILGLPVEGMI